MPPSQPNILLVHCHDLGQYLGCYGVDVDTPNIDRLAREGALFENHFTAAPQCSPSRGCLMTGRHPHSNGLMGLAHGAWELHEDERAVPEYLNDAGYHTYLFGLQHVTQHKRIPPGCSVGSERHRSHHSLASLPSALPTRSLSVRAAGWPS